MKHAKVNDTTFRKQLALIYDEQTPEMVSDGFISDEEADEMAAIIEFLRSGRVYTPYRAQIKEYIDNKFSNDLMYLVYSKAPYN